MLQKGEPKRALDALEYAALSDDTALVREVALGALARSAPGVARRTLARAAGGDPEPRVRKTAEALLASLSP
jgi:hypothetical protein